MKISEFTFIKRLLLDSDITQASDLLNLDVQFSSEKPDDIIQKQNRIIYSSPTSVFKFLFKLSYFVLNQIVDETKKDSLTVFLLNECKNYVYNDYKSYESNDIKLPVIVSFEKLHSIEVIVSDIIEPIIGKIHRPKILFTKCNFTDSARLSDSQNDLSTLYNLNSRIELPIIVSNFNVHNKASVYANLLYYVLKSNFEEEKTNKILKNVLLGQHDLLNYILTILKTIEGDPVFALEFLDYLEINCLSIDEQKEVNEKIKTRANTDVFFAKTANQFKQWDQLSMMLGLIEQQLAPMRGSMWPTTENMRPHDDLLRQTIKEKSRNKNTTQLTLPDMLETIRDIYRDNAIEPGKLIEVMLRDNRIWK